MILKVCDLHIGEKVACVGIKDGIVPFCLNPLAEGVDHGRRHRGGHPGGTRTGIRRALDIEGDRKVKLLSLIHI